MTTKKSKSTNTRKGKSSQERFVANSPVTFIPPKKSNSKKSK